MTLALGMFLGFLAMFVLPCVVYKFVKRVFDHAGKA